MTHSGARRPDGWVALGMAVSAVSAAVSSFSGLRGLALVAGWSEWLAPLLPLVVDSWALTATRVWLAGSTGSVRARRFARTNAIGAIVLSVVGNATFHLVAVQLVAASWPVVVAVGAVPALVLGLVAHLAVLRTQVDAAGPAEDARVSTGLGEQLDGTESGTVARQSRPGPAPRTQDGPRDRTGTARTERDLLTAARAAEAGYRAAHGRGITRDALRQELGIGGARATVLLRQLKAEAIPPVEQL